MTNIKVLGTGCANCKTTLKLIEQAAKAKSAEIALEKVEDLPTIMGYGVMSTPGVVVDGKVVHAGGIPSKESIDGWLGGTGADSCCSGTGNSGDSKCCG